MGDGNDSGIDGEQDDEWPGQYAKKIIYLCQYINSYYDNDADSSMKPSAFIM